MDYFGDESGHLESLPTGDCEVWTVVVIAGDKLAASRCAKKPVRNVTDVNEAKWNDLTDIQKRRFIDCVSDLDSLEFAHATIEAPQRFWAPRSGYSLWQPASAERTRSTSPGSSC